MKQMYAVKDLAVQAFGDPFTVRAPGEAIRSFQDEANRTDGNSAIAKHPEDYELYLVGTYEDQTGTICGQPPELIARAKDLLTLKGA